MSSSRSNVHVNPQPVVTYLYFILLGIFICPNLLSPQHFNILSILIAQKCNYYPLNNFIFESKPYGILLAL